MSDVEILLDSCPEDDSIFLWYGVLWDAMLEANHEWADGVKFLIDHRKRPTKERDRGPNATRKWEWFDKVDGWPSENTLPDRITHWMIGEGEWMGSLSIGDQILYFLQAYHFVYNKVPA